MDVFHAGLNYLSKRRKISEPFVPPNPNTAQVIPDDQFAITQFGGPSPPHANPTTPEGFEQEEAEVLIEEEQLGLTGTTPPSLAKLLQAAYQLMDTHLT